MFIYNLCWQPVSMIFTSNQINWSNVPWSRRGEWLFILHINCVNAALVPGNCKSYTYIATNMSWHMAVKNISMYVANCVCFTHMWKCYMCQSCSEAININTHIHNVMWGGSDAKKNVIQLWCLSNWLDEEKKSEQTLSRA